MIPSEDSLYPGSSYHGKKKKRICMGDKAAFCCDSVERACNDFFCNIWTFCAYFSKFGNKESLVSSRSESSRNSIRASILESKLTSSVICCGVKRSCPSGHSVVGIFYLLFEDL